MISAYLVVSSTRFNTGKSFICIANRINERCGTNISALRKSRNEMVGRRTYIWRCNGLCRYKEPFYGWIQKAADEKPSDKDLWWTEHRKACGGQFNKMCIPQQALANDVCNVPKTVFSLPKKSWKDVGEDILVEELEYSIIEVLDDDDDIDISSNKQVIKSEATGPPAVLKELIEELGEDDSSIELVNTSDSIIDCSLLSLDSSVIEVPNENIECPVCQSKIRREHFSGHLETTICNLPTSLLNITRIDIKSPKLEVRPMVLDDSIEIVDINPPTSSNPNYRARKVIFHDIL